MVNARYEELFRLVLAELRRSGFEDLIAAGIVLTGGASQMEGCLELAEHTFQMPVRTGTPCHVEGLTDVLHNPIYATGVGLLLHGYQQQMQRNNRPKLMPHPSTKGVWARMRGWFQGNF